jgi:hypothetical protein
MIVASRAILLLVIPFTVGNAIATDSGRVGDIEFFGYKGLDVATLRNLDQHLWPNRLGQNPGQNSAFRYPRVDVCTCSPIMLRIYPRRAQH